MIKIKCQNIFLEVFLARLFLALFFFFSFNLAFRNQSWAQNDFPPIQLANIYHQDVDVKNYLISEKLDGLRAYWDGKSLISKEGVVYNAPYWFIKTLPKQPVEGELWIDRGKFELVSSIVRKQNPIDEEWQQVHLMLFDMPSYKGNFLQRLQALKDLVDNCDCQNLRVIEQERVDGNNDLMIKLNEVVKNGGEGLMLRRFDSFYKVGRNDDLLKLKTYQDAEAVVIGYVEGKGKFRGLMGAILVKNEEGIKFKIGGGFTLKQRKNPPKIGEIITYKYFGKTKENKPRFASFLRVRKDIRPF